MVVWFKHLPEVKRDLSQWTPFIQQAWYRTHYMKFVYGLQLMLFAIPFLFETSFSHFGMQYLILLWIAVFIIHESLHILVVKKDGDISLTFSGIFFWLTTNAVLSKRKYLVFMSLPFIVLTVIPGVASFYVSGDIKAVFLFICWINAVISGSDIYNSILILMKPKKAVFCNGYYQINR
ncbi:DUF3267 domain-containing protein [Priestia koreensis]|uniref:DUF3267 domain-containing protein n=1 Tax=Priestia koreensis TaxID=284581 RepID=UPI0034597508